MTRADTYDETGPPRAALRRVRPAPVARPVEAARAARADLGAAHRRRHRPRPRPGRGARRETASTTCIVDVDGYLCEPQGRADPRRPAHPRATRPRARRSSTSCWPSPACPTAGCPSLRGAVADELGLDLDDPRSARRRRGAVPRRWSRRAAAAGWQPRRRRDPPTVQWVVRLAGAAGCARPATRSPTCCAGLDGRYVPAGPSGRAHPRRRPRAADRPQLLLRSTPRRCPPSCSWEVGVQAGRRAARPAPRRGGHLPAHGRAGPVGHGAHAHPGRRRRRGARPAGRPAGVGAGVPPGRRPRADPARRARPAAHRRDPAHLRLLPRRLPQPGRTCSTTRSRWPASLDEPRRAELRACPRRRRPPRLRPGARRVRRRASCSCSSSATGAPTTTWPPSTSPGRATPTAAPASACADEDAMRRRFAAIDVAVKNQDNREHDIFDSDDYLQEHGGMIATIRSLTGRDPKAWFGDSADPARPVGALAGRGGGAGRAHPGGQPAVDRGHAAPRLQGRVRDGRHGRLPVRLRRHRPRRRRLDVRAGHRAPTSPIPTVRKFFEQSNPWALRLDRRAAARGRRAGHVGRQRRGTWPRCATRCSRPRAGRRAR